MCLVSVIIPAYNCKDTIEKCILSVLSQTYSDYEVIVIDDGSTDGTYNVLKRLLNTDSRMRVISQKNAGVSNTRNKGITLANGEFVAFIDSDDYIEENYLQELIEIYEQGTLPVVNFSYNADKKGVLPLKKSYLQIFVNKNIFREYFYGELGNLVSFSVWNKLYKKEILLKNNITFCGDLKLGEDLMFNLHYLCHCDSVTVSSKPLYNYVIRENSAVNSSMTNYAQLYECTYKAILVFCEENNVEIDYCALANWSFTVAKYSLSNRFVTGKNYFDFKHYVNEFKNLEFVITAKKHQAYENRKDKLLSICLKQKSSFLFYLLVKLNNAYQKHKR